MADEEGEEQPAEPQLPSLRPAFAVALLAGKGVDLSGLQELVAGGSATGFSLLSRDDVLKDGDDEEVVAKKAAFEEENPDAPLPPEIFGGLLKSVLGKPGTGERPEAPEGDDALGVLLRNSRGPEKYLVSFDIPSSAEEAGQFKDGGGFDAVFLVQKPPVAEGEDSVDEQQEEAAEQATEEGEAQPPKISTEDLFSNLYEVAGSQRQDGHNPNADTTFKQLLYTEDPAELMQILARALVPIVAGKVEYVDWLAGVNIVTTKPGHVDLNHYDKVLEKVPQQSMSVPVVLDALLQQVSLNSIDEEGENRAQRQVWKQNYSLIDELDAAMSSLSTSAAPHPTQLKTEQHQRKMMLAGDQVNYRLEDPYLTPEMQMAVQATERNASLFLNLEGLFPTPNTYDSRDDPVLKSVPGTLSLSQAQRGLLLCELEHLIGMGDSGAFGADNEEIAMSLHEHCFEEELSRDAVQQTVMQALSTEPEILTRYYDREDLLLIAFCNLVPEDRMSFKAWKSETSCQLGFLQWMEARNREHEHFLQETAAGETTMDAESEVEAPPEAAAETEEGGDAAEEDEGEEKAKPPPPVPTTGLPVPSRPDRIYDLDANRAALFDDEQRLHAWGGTPIKVGRNSQGRYVDFSTPRHKVHLRQQFPPPEETPDAHAVSMTYSDGACFMWRWNRNPELNEVSVSFASGLHITMAGDGIVWQSFPHSRSLRPLSWLAPSMNESASTPKELLHSVGVLDSGDSVVRQTDGKAKVLMSDGCCGLFLGKDKGWEWTNSKGLRQAKEPQFDEPQFREAVAIVKDSAKTTGKVSVVRHDDVVQVITKDGSRLVQHADGSQILTTADGFTRVIRAEHADVQVGPNQHKRIVCPDESVISLRDGELEFKRPDGSSLRGNWLLGTATFFSNGYPKEEGSEVVSDLASPGHREVIDLVANTKEENRNGIYYMELSTGSFETPDLHGNLYKVNPEGNVMVSLSHKSEPEMPLEEGEEEVSLPPPTVRGRLEPDRILALRRDGSGFEIMHRSLAEAEIDQARAERAMLLNEPGIEDGTAMWTILKPDLRDTDRPKDTESILEPSMRYRSLKRTGGAGTGALMWRQLEMKPTPDRTELTALRECVEQVHSAKLQSAEGTEETAGTSPLMEGLIEKLKTLQGGSSAPIDFTDRGKQILKRIVDLTQTKPAPEPEAPAVERPPASYKPSAFRGIVEPEEPSILRPNYFATPEGSAFLDSLGPDARKPINKVKRPWNAKAEPDQEAEDIQEEEVGPLSTEDQDDFDLNTQEPPNFMPSATQKSRQSAGSIGSETRFTAEGRAMYRTGQSRGYHLKHLRPAHYDILNRPRKHRDPSMRDLARFDATPKSNAEYERVEAAYRRRTHTCSVLQKAMLTAARTATNLSLEESVIEPDVGKSFRLRPNKANLGVIELGKVTRFKLVLTNVGDEIARFRVQQPIDEGVAIVYSPGAVAPGISVVLEVEICAGEAGPIASSTQISTQSEIFTIPITANVLSPQDFQEWEIAGGHLPVNAASTEPKVVPPMDKTRSKAPPLITTKPAQRERSMPALGDPGMTGPLRDLQDPVSEPQVPSTEEDWFVDTLKPLSDLKDMTSAQRLKEKEKQILRRKGRPVAEEDPEQNDGPATATASVPGGGNLTDQTQNSEK